MKQNSARSRPLLDGEDLEPQMEHFRSQTVSGIVDAATAEGRPDQWDLKSLVLIIRFRPSPQKVQS